MESQKGLTKIGKNIIKADDNSCIQILKAVISQMPVASGVIYLWDNYVKSIGEENIRIGLEDIIDRKLVEKLKEIKADENEWNVLIKHAYIEIVRCTKEGQIHRIIDILEGKFDGKINSFNDAEDLINIVSELSENEAETLSKIYEIYRNKFDNFAVSGVAIPGGSDIRDKITISQKEIVMKVSKLRNIVDFILGRLTGKGLIKEKAISTYGDMSNNPKEYHITYVGELLFKSLKNDNFYSGNK